MSASRRIWWVLCVLPFLGFWTYGLFDLDEGFYAAVAADMLRRGEWITPTLNGAPWFEKPILLYWLAIPSLALFGEAIGPRLPSVLATLATALLIYRFASIRWGHDVARWSAVVFCSSLLVVGAGRMMLTDSLLVLFLAASLLLFESSLQGRMRDRYLAAACLGLAVLAKGPVAGIVFVAVVGILFLSDPARRPAFRGGWLGGTCVFLLVVASWYLPCWLANREAFVQEFLIEHNIKRFAGGNLAHRVPFWAHPIYYPLVVLVGMMPWSFFLLRKKVWRDSDDLNRLCVAWALVVLGFFTVSQSKLPHYALPAAVPLAMLAGRQLAGASTGFRKAAFVLWPAAALGIAQFGFSFHYTNAGFAEVHGLAKWVRANDPGTPVLVYQMSRREKGPPRIRVRLQETSLPSLFFYLPGPTSTAETLQDLAEASKPAWVLTREGRITTEDQVWLGKQGITLKSLAEDEREHFRLFRMEQTVPLR